MNLKQKPTATCRHSQICLKCKVLSYIMVDIAVRSTAVLFAFGEWYCFAVIFVCDEWYLLRKLRWRIEYH